MGAVETAVALFFDAGGEVVDEERGGGRKWFRKDIWDDLMVLVIFHLNSAL